MTDALVKAELAWGSHADISSIDFSPLPAGMAACTVWEDSRILIHVNSRMRFTRRYLEAVVTHEYGHALIGQLHFLTNGRRSIMRPVVIDAKWRFMDWQHVTRADREMARNLRKEQGQ